MQVQQAKSTAYNGMSKTNPNKHFFIKLEASIYNFVSQGYSTGTAENLTSARKFTINMPVQGCSLSPLLFIIYLDKIIKEWKLTNHPGIKLDRNTLFQTSFCRWPNFISKKWRLSTMIST